MASEFASSLCSYSFFLFIYFYLFCLLCTHIEKRTVDNNSLVILVCLFVCLIYRCLDCSSFFFLLAPLNMPRHRVLLYFFLFVYLFRPFSGFLFSFLSIGLTPMKCSSFLLDGAPILVSCVQGATQQRATKYKEKKKHTFSNTDTREIEKACDICVMSVHARH